MSELCKCDCDISIIIPVYNLEDYIAPMLLSLIEQDYGEYTHEIIFVLNNCTDDSEAMIHASGLDCKIINCEVQGCGPARNAGFEIAKGEYIWFLDGDDWLLSNTAVQQVLDKADGVQDIVYIPFASDTYKYQYFSMVPQYLLRRKFVEEFRFPNYQPAEDDAYMEQVLTKAGRNRYTYMHLPRIDHALYYYNFGRPGSNMMRYYSGEKI